MRRIVPIALIIGTSAAHVSPLLGDDGCQPTAGGAKTFLSRAAADDCRAKDPLCAVCGCPVDVVGRTRIKVEFDLSTSMVGSGKDQIRERGRQQQLLLLFGALMSGEVLPTGPVGSNIGIGRPIGPIELNETPDQLWLKFRAAPNVQTDIKTAIANAEDDTATVIVTDLVHEPTQGKRECGRNVTIDSEVKRVLRARKGASLTFLQYEALVDGCNGALPRDICRAANLDPDEAKRCRHVRLGQSTSVSEAAVSSALQSVKRSGSGCSSAHVGLSYRCLADLCNGPTPALVASNALCASLREVDGALQSSDIKLRLTKLPLDSSFGDVVIVGDHSGWACSGVAVEDNAVLTAKHCGEVSVVGLGERASDSLRLIRVEERRAHPTLDVALLRLEGNAEVALHSRRKRSDTTPPSSLRAVGFGARDSRATAGFGAKSMLDLTAAGWGCDGTRPGTIGCVEEHEMVVFGGPGADTCRGDSGGPVFELVPASAGSPCGYRLVATVSRSVGGADVACGAGGIYQRVDTIDEWISSTLKEFSNGVR